jgi:Na+/phosphate symporter
MGHFYIQELDYLREVAHCLTFIVKPSLKHVENNHKAMLSSQGAELKNLSSRLDAFIKNIQKLIKTKDLSDFNKLIENQQDLLSLTDQHRKAQLKRLKSEEVGTKNSLLYIALLHETRNLALHLLNLAKAHRDFVLNYKD